MHHPSGAERFFVLAYEQGSNNLEIPIWHLKSVEWEALKVKLFSHYRCFGVSRDDPPVRNDSTVVSEGASNRNNRRSQKKSYTFANYLNFLLFNPLPRPRVCHSFYTLRSLLGGLPEELRMVRQIRM